MSENPNVRDWIESELRLRYIFFSIWSLSSLTTRRGMLPAVVKLREGNMGAIKGEGERGRKEERW